MKLTHLNSLDKLNNQQLHFISGGTNLSIDTSTWADSASQDCRKNDTCSSTDSKKNDSITKFH